MNEQEHKEAEEIKKLPAALLEYLPTRRWRLTLAALIAFVFLLLVVLGLTLNTHIKYTRLEAELNRYESLWESKGISNYAYRITISEIYPMESVYETLRVRVNGEYSVVSVVSESSSLDTSEYDSIPDLFNKIRKLIQARVSVQWRQLVISYDPDLGYPTDIGLDMPNLLGFPGLFSYHIFNFTLLEPGQTTVN